MPKATLINPQGQKVVVESGSQEAQQYFGQGYTLMGSQQPAINAPTGTPEELRQQFLSQSQQRLAQQPAAIPGAFNTKEAQQQFFSNIAPVGQLGTPGSFLQGTPKQSQFTFNGVTYQADPQTGQVTPLEQIEDRTREQSGGRLSNVTFDELEGGSTADTTPDYITKFLQDLDLQRTNEQQLRERILTSLKPTEEEVSLKKEQAEIVDQARQLRRETQGAIDREENRPDALLPAIRGAQASFERAESRKRQELIDAEANILAELGIEQSKRNSLTSQLETLLGFSQLDRQDAFQVAQLQLELQKPIIDAENDVREFLLGLAGDFPDSGITLGDTMETASKKVLASPSYQEALLKTEATTDDIKEYNLSVAQGYAGSFLQYLRDKKIQTEQDLLAGLTGDQRNELSRLRTEVRQDPDIKGYIDVRDAYDRILSVADDPSAAGDLALIFNYMKLLDPGSVVREGEFATAQNTAGVDDRLRNTYNRLLTGERLTSTQRDDFINQARNVFEPKQRNYFSARDFYLNTAQQFGIPDDLVLRDFQTPEQETLDDIFGSTTDTEKLSGILNLQSSVFASGDQPTGGVKSGSRTDRHNNPTAFTTDIAKLAGLVEGVDYKEGDVFPSTEGGSRYRTAWILKNPIDVTIKVIDTIGFYTQGGGQRWTHTAYPKPTWDDMSYQEKVAVIQQMYQREGGTKLASLFSNIG